MARSAKPRTRTVSSSEAKQQWDALIAAASEGEDVVVEVSGEAKTVMISVEAFEELRQSRERRRREEAMGLLQEIEASYDGRTDDLTEEQVEEIAVRAGREINRSVAERLIERSRRDE
jgi:prevent-host-death family protein